MFTVLSLNQPVVLISCTLDFIVNILVTKNQNCFFHMLNIMINVGDYLIVKIPISLEIPATRKLAFPGHWPTDIHAYHDQLHLPSRHTGSPQDMEIVGQKRLSFLKDLTLRIPKFILREFHGSNVMEGHKNKQDKQKRD